MQISAIQNYLYNSHIKSDNTSSKLQLRPQLTKDIVNFSGIQRSSEMVFADKISQLACEIVLEARKGSETAIKKVADAMHLAKNPDASRESYDEATRLIAHTYQHSSLDYSGKVLKHNAYDYPQLYRMIGKEEYEKLIKGEHVISPDYNTIFVTNNPNGVAANTRTKERYFVTFKLKDDLDLFCRNFLASTKKRNIDAHNIENAEYCIDEGYSLADVENIRKNNVKGQIVYAEDIAKAIAADKQQKQEIIDALIQKTRSGSEEEIKESLDKLDKYCDEFPTIAASVSHLLGNSNFDIHGKVFSIILQSGDRSHIKTVTSYIDNQKTIGNSPLRANLLNCLIRFGDNEHLDYVLKLFEQCSDYFEFFDLADAFSKFAKPTDIEKILKYKDSPQPEQQRALLRIIGQMNAKEHLPLLKEKLYSANPDIKADAIEMIGHIGSKADTVDIAHCLTDEDTNVRYTAEKVINDLNEK